MHIQLYGNNLPLATIRKAQEGNKTARAKVMEHYLPRIHKEATRYRSLPFEEAVAAGCEGMLRGLRKFNPKIDKDFWKYAFFWVRAYVIKEVKWQYKARRDIVGYFVPHDEGEEGTAIRALTEERLAKVEDSRFSEFEDDDEYQEVLRTAKRILSVREHDILEGRLQGGTLQGVGDKLGVSRERVRQVEFRIHSKIKEAMTA